MGFKRYIHDILVSLDQLANVVVFRGSPDETVSSHWGRTQKTDKVAEVGCKILDKIDPGHCDTSVEFDKDGKPNPLHLKKYD